MLTVTRKRKPINFPYCVHGNELSLCKAEKDLGLLVSSDLKWGPHILKTVAKANKMLGLLKRSCFEITNTQNKRTFLYLTLVRSQLTYGYEVWCPSSRQLSLKIEGVQRRATLLGLLTYGITFVRLLLRTALTLYPPSKHTSIRLISNLLPLLTILTYLVRTH